MTDEPSSRATDERLAELMTQLLESDLDPRTADGRAGLGALRREFETQAPGALQRMLDHLDARKVRLGRVTLQ